MQRDFVFISESVTEGHPDKLCDRISDAIVDRFLEQDPMAHVIAECAVANGVVFLASRFDSDATVDIADTARRVIREAGYRSGPFNAEDCTILTSFRAQQGSRADPPLDEMDLDEGDLDRITAKDQVTAFGYACDQTASLMPLPIVQAHRLARQLRSVRIEGSLPYLSPDGKVQIGIRFEHRQPVGIQSVTIIASQSESDQPSLERLRNDVVARVVDTSFEGDLKPDDSTRIFVNPEGVLIGGGPESHAGLTGRKTAIDTYGEYARHSGAALSGKGPTRVDRIAAYAARHAAKNVVAAGLAKECEVQLSYSIGLPQPISIQVDTYDTGRISDDEICKRLLGEWDFRVGGVMRRFNLRRLPQAHNGRFFRNLACFGHMGREDLAAPWEDTGEAARLAS